jgi:hypothetical protein
MESGLEKNSQTARGLEITNSYSNPVSLEINIGRSRFGASKPNKKLVVPLAPEHHGDFDD